MNLILLGAPGAGKGTLASFLVEKMGVPSVSTGNILREAIANHTELGQKAKAFMDAGQLVPDQLVIDLLRDRIAQDDCKNGFILDGFPRTIPQAEALDQIASIDCALSLEVDDAVIEGRMTGRRVCLKCGATYHIKANPPKRRVSAMSAATRCTSARTISPMWSATVLRPIMSRPSRSRITTARRASSRALTARRGSSRLRCSPARHWACKPI